MAYSDYGGYGYRNGERIMERSDAVFTAEGLKSTCGMWPGFAIPEGRHGGSYHVILGDGPVYLSMYKQSGIGLVEGPNELNFGELALAKYPEAKWVSKDGDVYFENDYFQAREIPCELEVNGHKLSVYFEYTDNYYQYAKLEQPDGTIWTGFSGYGVGAGLEDCGYGYSTQNCIDRLEDLFR